MARRFDFSKLNFFNRLDARSRVFVLLAGFLGMVMIIYLVTRYLSGGGATVSTSRVANAPAGLQSVPGETPSPAYFRSLEQLNAQRAQQAQMTGVSAVPTLINPGQPAVSGGCVICAEETSNVKYKLDDWVKKGQISPDVAAELQALADKGVSEAEYAAKLDELVRQGKLTPEQARELLELYRKQHANQLLKDSAKLMDPLIQSGQLPLDVANELLAAQKNNMSPSDYAALLQRMVREGKISPEVAQQLLAQYTQQRTREIIARSISTLESMSRSGQITPDVLKDLVDLEANMVPLDAFTNVVKKYLTAGKLVPAVAEKIIAEYKAQKSAIGPSQTITQMLEKAEAAAYAEISELLKAGKITAEVANQLAGMIQQNISLEDFQRGLSILVEQRKLTPEIAKLKYADYQKVKGLRDLAARLSALQANNATPASYADELKRAVAAGLITPEEAARLMQEYQAMMARAAAAAAGPAASAEFAKLQAQVQQAGVTGAPPPAEFATAQVQAVQESAQDRAARIQALMQAMSAQAQSLIASWQPPVMLNRQGVQTTTTEKTTTAAEGAAGGKSTTTTTTTTTQALPPIIKAGTILFAVLDTTVNSDYPDNPVMATIVQGPFKGAKLLGKLQTTKSVAGQMDRVTLNFTLMNEDHWPTTKGVTAYGIDPDTARIAIASSVNYHYMLRFGSMFATAFLQGYATAITTSASTSTTGIFGTSTTHPSLSPGQKIAVALGQVGQTLGQVTQNYANIPPTVKVDSGVGLGILFMSDVS